MGDPATITKETETKGTEKGTRNPPPPEGKGQETAPQEQQKGGKGQGLEAIDECGLNITSGTGVWTTTWKTNPLSER